MSGRIFQGVVLQMKENTDRTIGVMDGEGVVVACSELTLIGQRWAEYVNPINNAAGALLCLEGKTFKALTGWGTQFDYAAFALGDNEISRTVCSVSKPTTKDCSTTVWSSSRSADFPWNG